MAARKEVDRLACQAWNKRMLGLQGPAQPSPTIGDALNAGYCYLEVRCLGCDTHQTVALDIIRRPKATSIHELDAGDRTRRHIQNDTRALGGCLDDRAYPDWLRLDAGRCCGAAHCHAAARHHQGEGARLARKVHEQTCREFRKYDPPGTLKNYCADVK
jgi:hypothetical protein